MIESKQSHREQCENLCADLRLHVVPLIVAQAEIARRPVRVWMPECGTGEEAYAAAACFFDVHPAYGLMYFATDSDAGNIQRSRTSIIPADRYDIFPEDIAARFLVPHPEGFILRNDVRNCCVFSHHELLIDPPFSKIDLIIFIKDLHAFYVRHVPSLLHYALRPEGYVWFCNVPELAKVDQLFEATPATPKLLKKKAVLHPVDYEFPKGRKCYHDRLSEEEVGGLQSSLEELTAAQEELQTSNEELASVNRMLEERNRELSEANTDFNNLIQSMGMPVIMVDAEHRIRLWNQHGARVFNIRPQDKLRRLDDLQPRISLPDLNHLLMQVIDERTPHEMEIQDIDGRWNLLRIMPYTRADGKPDGAIITLLDVHELRKSRDNEKLARAEAEAANAAKDQFLANLSHELRTPLTPILAWTQLLREKIWDTNALRKGLDTIERAVRTQRQLIEDLLDISRIAAGKLSLLKRRTFISEILQGAVEMVRSTADAKKITIDDNISADAAVVCDPVRLQQVFWNILVNAVRFSQPGGKIQIRVRRESGQLQIKIVDFGEGIAAADLPGIFDRFRQADGSTTRQHGGLGLGLAIAQSIVHLHGGSIRADSAGKGRGATFTVTLKEAAAAELKSQGAAQEDLKGVRILLVDDDEDTLETTAQVLQESGADVSKARTAEEALELIGRKPPDVLLCDLTTSGDDCYSLIRKIRSRQELQNLPAIALASDAETDGEHSVREDGFHAHLAKPVDFIKLHEKIRDLLTVA
jgi:two-component system, chemotaxis family, CheB/CheR fusion protein